MPTNIIGMRRNSGIDFYSRYRLISFTAHVKPAGWVCLLLLSFFLVSPAQVAAETSPLAKGEELYLENRLEEALPLLETARLQNPDDERIYIYLGNIYEQLGQFEKAVNVLQRGTLVAEIYLDLMYFNIANNLFKQNKLVLADEMYDRSVRTNPQFADAYLNRANLSVMLGEFDGAVDDYTVYLNLRPASSQRADIEKMLSLLSRKIETARAEEAVEQERIAAEEARQKALLDEVLSSLQKASEDTKSLSAESEGIESTQEESDIVN